MAQGSDGASTAERGRRRKPAETAPPVWFGIPFLGMGLLVVGLGVAIMLGTAPRGTTVDGSPLAIIGFGAIFALVGGALIWTSIRARRLQPHASGGANALVPTGPSASSARPLGAQATVRFTRSPMQALMDLVLAPIGGIGFLGLAVFLFTSGGMGFLIAVLPAFFGVLMLSGAAVTMRRGLRGQIAEVGPAGISTPEMGRLAWSQIAEVRVEDMRGVGGRNNTGTAVYRRLGIVPRDPSLAARAPGRLAVRMVRGFTGLVNSMRPSPGLSDPSALAPFGINASEIEQPFEDVIAAVERYMPVTGAGVLPPTRPILPGLDASVFDGLSGASGMMRDPSTGAERAGSGPADLPAPRTFRRRSTLLPMGGLGLLSDAWSAAFLIILPGVFLVVFPVLMFSSTGPFQPMTFVVLAFLVIPLGFAVWGIGRALQVPIRQRFRTGGPDLLTVDADGIDMRGMGRLRWSEIREVRATDSDVPVGEDEGTVPRLEIVPHDPRRLAARPRAERWYDAYRSLLRRLKPFGDRSPIEPSFGLDFDLLDASPDEVLDLIARYRVVDDRT